MIHQAMTIEEPIRAAPQCRTQRRITRPSITATNSAKARRRGIQIERLESMENVQLRAARLDDLGCWKRGGPIAAVDVASDCVEGS